MGSLVYILLGGVIVWFAFKTSIIAGIIAVLLIFAVLVYKLYPNFMIGRANAEFNNGNTKKAIRMYNKILKTGRADLETRIAYASLLMRSDCADKALLEINKILSIHLDQKTRHIAKQTRSMINYRLGNMDEAMEELNELFDDGYKTSHTYSMMGYFMLLLNKPIEETLALCEEAYDYDSDQRDIVDNLEVCYYRMGRLEDAKKISDKLTEMAPDFVEAFYHGAQICYALGDIDKAREYANHIKDCKRSVMTTVSESDANALTAKINA